MKSHFHFNSAWNDIFSPLCLKSQKSLLFTSLETNFITLPRFFMTGYFTGWFWICCWIDISGAGRHIGWPIKCIGSDIRHLFHDVIRWAIWCDWWYGSEYNHGNNAMLWNDYYCCDTGGSKTTSCSIQQNLNKTKQQQKPYKLYSLLCVLITYYYISAYSVHLQRICEL